MKLPKSVEHWDDERNCDNGIIITVKSGYHWIDDHGLHVKGFDTVTEARKALRDIERCRCKLCED